MILTDDATSIDDLDLERHMKDAGYRLDRLGSAQQRARALQNFVYKFQNMSEADFESALTACESVVDGILRRAQNVRKSADSRQATKVI